MRIGFRRKQAGGERLWLGAFGKHPAWDDHFETPGLETARLTQLRTSLYSEGVGGRIDSGAWDKLDEGERIDGFAHTLVWRTPEGMLAGRLIDSVDGKGRRRYPLVIAAHTRGLPGAWVCGTLCERLARLGDTCADSSAREGVLTEIELARSELRGEAGLLGEASERVEGENALRTLVEGVGREAVERVVYQCVRDMGAFLRGGLRGARSTSRTLDVSAKSCRAPAFGASAGEACGLWVRVLGRLVGDGAPVMAIAHDSMGMVDILVGEPEAEQFYCLRAGASALPLSSEVPYEIDQATRSWVESTLGDEQGDRDPGWIGRRR